jgi:DNA-binding response OmpR family regulator
MLPEKLNPAEHKAQEISEVLLLDMDERIRDGMSKLLATSDMLVTATDDEQRALSLATQKYFAVAVLDMDTPAPEKGLEMLTHMRSISPATAIVLLTKRQTFDLAVRGFRGGAADVVAKQPQNVKGLVEKVTALCLEIKRHDERLRLLKETLEVHEQFLKRLMDASRKAMQAEDMAKGQSDRWDLKACLVLVVDDNPQTAQGLQEALGKESAYRCVCALTGGEAFDCASQQGFQVALVKENLPDLPGRMVVKSLRRQSPDGIVLLFTDPASGPGSVAIIEENQTIELVPQLTRGGQLVDVIHQMREACVAKSRERYYLQAFRRENYDFLKRYVELRQKLSAQFPEGVK